MPLPPLHNSNSSLRSSARCSSQRKKWERNWDEVTTCSKTCNAQRKGEKKSLKQKDASDDTGRRNAITLLPLLLIPAPALAAASDPDSFGSQTFRAVTQSGIGKSVRRDVVAGAQFMDKVDGAWERFSDENGLGSARKSSQPYPSTTPPPPPLPLDLSALASVLSLCADSFLASNPSCSSEQLAKETERISKLMRPAFPKGDDRKVRRCEV